jgi:hypothetical protein
MEHIHWSQHQHNRPMQPIAENLAAEIRLEEELLSHTSTCAPCATGDFGRDVRGHCSPGMVSDP